VDGDSQSVADGKIIDWDLLELFAVVEQLDTSDQIMVKTFIDVLGRRRV
jgi:hypothetical protein